MNKNLKRMIRTTILIMGFTFITSISVDAQAKLFEGYDNLPWGTSVEIFKQKNPTATEETQSSDDSENQRLFYKETDSITRVYRFYDNKLYWGRTVYVDPDETTQAAILSKVIDTYGNFKNTNKWSEGNNEHIILSNDVSRLFSITIESIEKYNSYGRMDNLLLFITYENTEIADEVRYFAKKQKEKNIEL